MERAFPQSMPGSPGMTLRDYFAAKALQGMLASEVTANRMEVTIDDYATDSYRYADAMLKARDA